MANRGREADKRQRESNYIQMKTNLHSFSLYNNQNNEAGNSPQMQPKTNETDSIIHENSSVKPLFPVVRTLPESPPDSSSEPYSPQQVNGE